MQKNLRISLIAAAVAAALPVPALADVTVYGRANVSVDYLDNGGKDAAEYAEVNISSNSSRLGFKADKKTESGITGFMQLEAEVFYNRDVAVNFGRDSFVGLKGNFGSVRIGRFDSPFKAARGPANLFGDQLGDMRNLTRVSDARFDERNDNTIHYQTPSFAGVNINLAYSLHEGTQQAVTVTGTEAEAVKDEVISTSVTYKGGPVDVAVAYEKYSEEWSRGERDAIRAAIAYKVIDPLKLVAFYQVVDYTAGDKNVPADQAKQDNLTSDVLGLGIEYAITKSTAVKGMYLMRKTDADDRDSDMFTVGVEHKLDSALRIYANYAQVGNDDNIALTPWSQARSATPAGANGETASGVSLGLRFDF